MNLSAFNEFLLIILLILIVLLVRFFIGREFCAAAEEKGYDSSKYLWWILFTGIPGMLLVTALPDRGESAISDRNAPKQSDVHSAPVQQSNPAVPVSAARVGAHHIKTGSAGTISPAAKSSSSRASLEAQDCDSLPRL